MNDCDSHSVQKPELKLWEWKRLVEESEKSLVLGHYETSESISHDILHTKELVDDSLRERAAIVFVQSVFETLHFSKARGVLCSSFSSLEKVPANVILLWISLALETDDRRQADSLIVALLKSKGSRQSGWTREQYLTLVRMYATDILLPTLKDPSEVHLWFRRQSFIPLDPREVQFLENEVSEKALLSQQHSTAERNAMPVITPMASVSQRSSLESTLHSPGSKRTSDHIFDRERMYGDHHIVEHNSNTSQDTPDLDFLGMVQKTVFRTLGMKMDSEQEQQPSLWTMATTMGGVAALTYILLFEL